MTRDELLEGLRLLCATCQKPHLSKVFPHNFISCALCERKLTKIMELVDAYTETLPVPELMGTKEVAELNGFSATRVGHYVSKGRLTVVQRLAMGPIFRATEARKFAEIPRPRGNPNWQKPGESLM